MPILGVDSRLKQLTKSFIAAKDNRRRFHSALFTKNICHVTQLLSSTQEKDERELVESLAELRVLIQAHIPTGLSDGEFSIWPEPQLPVVYFMPPSAQLGLLYLPLFFHEFGHLLYAYHKPEMDDLVRDLQEKIAELLQPLSQRDDLHTQDQAKKRNVIVETWYEWTQELFCDAVGFVIGGPAFIKAFSMFFLMLGQGRFNLPSDQLEQSQHPVAWLRICLLTELGQYSQQTPTVTMIGKGELCRPFLKAAMIATCQHRHVALIVH